MKRETYTAATYILSIAVLEYVKDAFWLSFTDANHRGDDLFRRKCLLCLPKVPYDGRA